MRKYKLSRQTSLTLGALSLLPCLLTAITATAAPGEIAIPVEEGTIIIPPSSIASPEDAGILAHTNTQIFVPLGPRVAHSHPSGKHETPASLACVYGLVAPSPGCNPKTAKTIPTGGSQVIAIVDAYDYATAVNDLGVFSAEFGLPPITQDNFQIVYATGVQPKQDPNGYWELEESLDIEMAHAMAPNAKIILVEAASYTLKQLYAATQIAAGLVAAAGGGEVSMSWGGAETKGEEALEAMFAGQNVVFVAATGDEPGTNQPSVLQNVIAAGGTSINRDDGYNFLSQSAWKATGGGASQFVPIPAYQATISPIVGTARGVPDMAFDADPRTGVWIYDSTAYFTHVYDWEVIGGTSVAAPALAGILNSAGRFAASTQAELTTVYGKYEKNKFWADVHKGKCGLNGVFLARKNWDFCTGVGVPQGYGKK